MASTAYVAQVDELELELAASSANVTTKIDELQNKTSAFQGTFDDLVKNSTSYDSKISSLKST